MVENDTMIQFIAYQNGQVLAPEKSGKAKKIDQRIFYKFSIGFLLVLMLSMLQK